MYRRWITGEFGQPIRYWATPAEFMIDVGLGRWPFDCVVALRYKKPGYPFCAYDLEPCDVSAKVEEFVDAGADPKLLCVNQSNNPDDCLVIQGEAYRSHRGIELRYSYAKAKMRIALEQSERNAHGLKARLILKDRMPNADFEWLEELFDLYPDHVVEFSTWSVPFGAWGRNTVFWEVRKY